MSTRLNDLPLEQVHKLFMHPLHQDAFRTMVSMIAALRECEAYPDYRDLQQDLLTKLLEVDGHRLRSRQVLRRLRGRKSLPVDAPALRSGADPTDIESWELEIAVSERIGRQYRSIGDALAWRVFNYDRRVIIALSRNDPPGLLAGKAGLAAEQEFVAKWSRDDDTFVLLHDVTSCLRIGDATLFKRVGDGFEGYLYEIKRDSERRRSTQLRRQRLAQDAVRAGGALPGKPGHHLVSVNLPYKTQLDLLGRAFELAAERGLYGMNLPDGRALLAADLRQGYGRWSEEEFLAQADRAYKQVLQHAHILDARHHVYYMSDDLVARTPITPPWAIYPLPPLTCANLMADMSLYVVAITSDPLLNALEGAGLRAEWVLPPGQKEMQTGQVILRAWNSRRGMEMRPAEMQRVLLELVDLPIWAEGIKRMLDREDWAPHPWPYFADEWRVWE